MAGLHSTVVSELSRLLSSRFEAALARYVPPEQRTLTEEDLERLRSLGYVR